MFSPEATIGLKDIPSAGELARPSNVNAQFDKAKTTVKISWDAVEGASYYDVSLEGHDSYDSYWTIFKVIKTVPATQTECVYAEAVAGPYIYIKVAARDSDFSDSCRWSKDFVLEL